MGLDIRYQAIPEACRLLARARLEPEFGTYLEFFKSYASKSQKELVRYTARQLIEFIYEARNLVEQEPGIEHRNLDFGRGWDLLYYLLSQRRRDGEKEDWSHWVERALFGGEVLNEATHTTIGFPIRYLHPMEVSDVKDKLETVTIEMLRSHWNPVAMSKEFEFTKFNLMKVKTTSNGYRKILTNLKLFIP